MRRPAALGVGETVTVRGVVALVDASARPLDGDALVTVRTEAGERTVRVPAREARCPATDLAPLEALTRGVRVQARGTVAPAGDVTPCADSRHYNHRLGE